MNNHNQIIWFSVGRVDPSNHLNYAFINIQIISAPPYLLSAITMPLYCHHQMCKKNCSSQDTRANAEAAKAAIDGTPMKGRTLRCRFATHGAALKVLHLSPHVSNEVLEEAFANFGELERAVVIVDDRGKSTSEGIVEFARKPGYNAAMKRLNEGVFLLGM